MSLYQKQKELVKEKIFETSVAVFREKGYDEATIDEITRRVGIAKGTFYNFYSSKSEILRAWSVRQFQSFDFSAALDAGKKSEDNLYSFVKILAEAIHKERLLFQSFLKEILKEQGDSHHDNQFDMVRIYDEILSRSSDYHVVREFMHDVKIEVLNSALFMGMIKALRRNESVKELEEELNNIVWVCMHGLLGKQRG